MSWLATVKLSLVHTSGYYRQLLTVSSQNLIPKENIGRGQSREWPWQFFQCAVTGWHPCCAKIGLLERTYLSHLIPRLQDECHNFDCWTGKSFPILGLTDLYNWFKWSRIVAWYTKLYKTNLWLGEDKFSNNCLCRFSQHCNNLSDWFSLLITNKSASIPTAGVIPLIFIQNTGTSPYPPTVKGSHTPPTIWGHRDTPS